MDAPDLIESLAGDRVVVFGSLPPAGRDIDLVARSPEIEALTRGLREAGFVALGTSLVRFRDCGVEAVELVPVSDWNLPGSASEELFTRALPLRGAAHLCRPSPEHAMLIAARRLSRARGRGSGKPAARFNAALEEDREALGTAFAAAADWGVEPALVALRDTAAFGPLDRFRHGYAQSRSRGSNPAAALARAGRGVLPRRPRAGALVALSGLDGSGKSTQAAALAETLNRLGFDARVEWVSMATPPWLDRLAGTVKALLRPALARGNTADTRSKETNPVLERASPDPVRDARRASPALTMAWSSLLALRIALRAGVMLRTEVWGGRVIVCDRYVLDAWTYLRYHYEAAPTLRPQIGLIRLLSPRPLRAYALIVDPDTATRRKADFDPTENARRLSYYEEMMDRLGVTAIDGTLPPEQLCSRIATEVTHALG